MEMVHRFITIGAFKDIGPRFFLTSAVQILSHFYFAFIMCLGDAVQQQP